MDEKIEFRTLSCDVEFAKRLGKQLMGAEEKIDLLPLVKCWCKVPIIEMVTPTRIIAVVRVLEDKDHYVFDTTWLVHTSKDEREKIMREFEKRFRSVPTNTQWKTVWWIGC